MSLAREMFPCCPLNGTVCPICGSIITEHPDGGITFHLNAPRQHEEHVITYQVAQLTEILKDVPNPLWMLQDELARIYHEGKEPECRTDDWNSWPVSRSPS